MVEGCVYSKGENGGRWRKMADAMAAEGLVGQGRAGGQEGIRVRVRVRVRALFGL